MTDHELVKAVLESCGWKPCVWQYPLETPDIAEACMWEKNGHKIGNAQLPPILTSLDACCETFEKDAPDGYWDKLIDVYEESKGGFDYDEEIQFACGRAIPRQRCLAWLKFKGITLE